MEPDAAATLAIIAAQEAVADPEAYPEFVGNVAVIDTRSFWRQAADSPLPDQPEHWYQNGEPYCLIGDGLGTAMVSVVPEPALLTWAAVSLAAVAVGLGLRRRTCSPGR
jgi:hypothetical protein